MRLPVVSDKTRFITCTLFATFQNSPAANQLECSRIHRNNCTLALHYGIVCMELYCGIEWYCRTVLGCISTIKMILGEWREITQCQICCSKLQHKELLTRLIQILIVVGAIQRNKIVWMTLIGMGECTPTGQ